ncbi:hypothetical protein [Flavobacterium mesophilum]|uniref:hypothetical protein n=1 Tax=Flavobacterium mesophilum TaxID=3143495 RepID=UPI0031D32236
MKCHTLILSTAKVSIPQPVTIDFVTNLINRGLTAIDYFGEEIDNPESFVEEDMKAVSETISYFDFFFETESEIQYDTLNEVQVDEYILKTISDSSKIEIKSDEKDLLIYLHY